MAISLQHQAAGQLARVSSAGSGGKISTAGASSCGGSEIEVVQTSGAGQSGYPAAINIQSVLQFRDLCVAINNKENIA